MAWRAGWRAGVLCFAPAAALVLVASASAQTATPEAEKRLWCGEAMVLVSAAIAADGGSATELERQGRELLARAQLDLLQSGFSDAQLVVLGEAARENARAHLLDGTGTPQVSFEECRSLLGD